MYNQYSVFFEEDSPHLMRQFRRQTFRSPFDLVNCHIASPKLELGSGRRARYGRGWIVMIYEDRRSGAQPDSRDALLIASEPHKSSRLYLGLSFSLFLPPVLSLPLSSCPSFFFRCGELRPQVLALLTLPLCPPTPNPTRPARPILNLLWTSIIGARAPIITPTIQREL